MYGILKIKEMVPILKKCLVLNDKITCFYRKYCLK